MCGAESEANTPVVSVIVPARNEESCLAACLRSLVGQVGIAFEIIVVNDGSTDRTVEIARSFVNVGVVEAPELPTGWTGKNNAMRAGALVARAQWFLFTDADTVHLPGSLARSVAEAQSREVQLLSYSPSQEVVTFSEMAVMPVIFAELAGKYQPQEVSDPASSAAAANGQYLLVSRAAYEAVGGHAAVASSLLEDVALARRFKKSGYRIFFRYGGDAVRTRMYRGFAQLRDGWTKNLALLFPSTAALALKRGAEFVLIIGSTGLMLWATANLKWAMAIAGGMTAGILGFLFLRRIRKAHFSGLANLFSLLGLPMFSYLLLRSRLSYMRGSVSWKQRTYDPASGSRSTLQAGPRVSEGQTWSI